MTTLLFALCGGQVGNLVGLVIGTSISPMRPWLVFPAAAAGMILGGLFGRWVEKS